MCKTKVYVSVARQCGKRSQIIDELKELIENNKISSITPNKTIDELREFSNHDNSVTGVKGGK